MSRTREQREKSSIAPINIDRIITKGGKNDVLSKYF